VLPVDDNDTADAVETKAQLVAALEEAEKSQDCKIAVLKAKINCFRRNNLSSRPFNPGPSTSAPRPPKKAPNPAAKNIDCRYCGRKGHFQLDCNDRRRAGNPHGWFQRHPVLATFLCHSQLQCSGSHQRCCPARHLSTSRRWPRPGRIPSKSIC
jgi:hypothetical protein